MIEWSPANRYCSFNSYKGLAYYQQYRGIAAWLEGTRELPPPVECNLDPVAECNLACSFCICQGYLRKDRARAGETRYLDGAYMLRLVDFLAKWGVRGLCISGGGEPSLHPDIPSVIRHAKDHGMDIGFVTNGVEMSADLLDALMLCRWVALSIDAATTKTYKAVKGRNVLDRVRMNVQNLVERRYLSGSKVDLCVKFLILPENQHEIYEACWEAANMMNVQDFHARPADLGREDIDWKDKSELDLDAIELQFRQCHLLERPGFGVYTVTHKFDPELQVKHDFSRCLAAPLILPVLSDGNGYLCVEHKMEADYLLGPAAPDPSAILKWWGSEDHRRRTQMIKPDNMCGRCIYGEYHRQIEDAVLNDRMCLSFP